MLLLKIKPINFYFLFKHDILNLIRMLNNRLRESKLYFFHVNL